MKAEEIKTMMERIAKYNALETIRQDINTSLNDIAFANIPFRDSPFTGNHRESRLVESIEIRFTKTRGGENATSINLTRLHGVEGCELGEWLKATLRKKLEAVNAEIEAL